MRRKEVEDGIEKYAATIADASRAYANLGISALKTFFVANGFTRNRAVEIEFYYQPPRNRETREYIPTKADAYRMADSACSLRDRAIILMLFSSGLRNATLRALLVGAVKKEIDEGQNNILIPIRPEMKTVLPNACKGNIPYYTFLCDDGTQALKLYLNDRKERFGILNDDEPLFCTEYNQLPKEQRRLKTLTDRELQLIIKDAAKRAGLPRWRLVHPHALRKTYETILRAQMIDGSNLDVKTQEFLMGHILPNSQDNYYDYSKIETMRIVYSNLKFGRTVVENKFKLLRATIRRAFEGTDIDPDMLMIEYVKSLPSRSELSLKASFG
jgi:integrase